MQLFELVVHDLTRKKSALDVILGNEEIRTTTTAIGAGIENGFNVENQVSQANSDAEVDRGAYSDAAVDGLLSADAAAH